MEEWFNSTHNLQCKVKFPKKAKTCSGRLVAAAAARSKFYVGNKHAMVTVFRRIVETLNLGMRIFPDSTVADFANS
jgi:hypothetical protein